MSAFTVTQSNGFVCAENINSIGCCEIIEQSVFGRLIIKLEVQEKSAFNSRLNKKAPIFDFDATPAQADNFGAAPTGRDVKLQMA